MDAPINAPVKNMHSKSGGPLNTHGGTYIVARYVTNCGLDKHLINIDPKSYTSVWYDCIAFYRPPFWTHGHKRTSKTRG